MSRLPVIGLEFSFAEMERELESMRQVARPFLEPYSFAHVLPRLRTELENTHASSSQVSWQIHENEPIRTIQSNGEYEPSRKGDTVYGELTMIWEIRPIQMSGMKRNQRKRSFGLTGKASAKACIWKCEESGKPTELARWRFEIADAASPGCYFHVQVLGDTDDPVFPKSLPVPRLPSILLTPMDALEFLLAELFQTRWAEHIANEKKHIKNLTTLQRRRLLRVLKWKSDTIQGASGLPWTSLKRATPRPYNLLMP